MRKTITTLALALLLISCSAEPETNYSNTVTQKSDDTPIEYELNVPYDFPVEEEKETIYVTISLDCKKYNGDTQYDWVGRGMGTDGIMYIVKSSWTTVVDLETGKPRHKQIISAIPMVPGQLGLPC